MATHLHKLGKPLDENRANFMHLVLQFTRLGQQLENTLYIHGLNMRRQIYRPRLHHGIYDICNRGRLIVVLLL